MKAQKMANRPTEEARLRRLKDLAIYAAALVVLITVLGIVLPRL